MSLSDTPKRDDDPAKAEDVPALVCQPKNPALPLDGKNSEWVNLPARR